jgi:ubiquinone/menaquinone biosynthesis C-methylase UbiE
MDMNESGDDPWNWMQAHDVRRFGEGILDPAERARWCTAIFIGGLPYMWRVKAAPVRDMMYDKMSLRQGDRVLLLGESLPTCRFDTDLQERIGPTGELRAIDVIEQARDTVSTAKRGRGGVIGTWKYDYTSDVPDGYFDAIGVIQGVQHCDDWRECGAELVRVLKKGGILMMSEIGFSPKIETLADCDLHLQYWLDKLLAGIRTVKFSEIPYYSATDLWEAFDGLLDDRHCFDFKGLEMFWGAKP